MSYSSSYDNKCDSYNLTVSTVINKENAKCNYYINWDSIEAFVEIESTHENFSFAPFGAIENLTLKYIVKRHWKKIKHML